MQNDRSAFTLAARWLRASQHTVAFTGAGVSAESGIPTFRDEGGFWREFPVEEFATWAGLRRSALVQPRRVVQFVHALLAPIAHARPNAAHRALAELEQRVRVTVATQNIDGLHQDGGSTTVWEVHGSVFEVVTMRGRCVRLLSRRDLSRIVEALERAQRGALALPRLLIAMRRLLGLGRRGVHRPNLVLFGDALAEPAWSRALEAARTCDCLLQIGCSGVVWPAASLPLEAKAVGAHIISIDPQPAEGDVWLAGTAADVVPELVRATLGPGD